MATSPVIVRRLAVPIPRLPRGLAGLRLLHISDFHFRSWDRVTRAAHKALAGLPHDLCLITGDFVDHPPRWKESGRLAREFFESLPNTAPRYAVLGNHDDPRVIEQIEGPITLLRNEAVSIPFGECTLGLAGVEQSYRGGEQLETTIAGRPQADVSILMAHYPSTVYRIPSGTIDLVLSGHTHGGQIRLPFFGCAWTNDHLPRRFARGLHKVAGTLLHTSPGIGYSAAPLRLNCPAQITLLSLQPADIVSPESVADSDGNRHDASVAAV